MVQGNEEEVGIEGLFGVGMQEEVVVYYMEKEGVEPGHMEKVGAVNIVGEELDIVEEVLGIVEEVLGIEEEVPGIVERELGMTGFVPMNKKKLSLSLTMNRLAKKILSQGISRNFIKFYLLIFYGTLTTMRACQIHHCYRHRRRLQRMLGT